MSPLLLSENFLLLIINHPKSIHLSLWQADHHELFDALQKSECTWQTLSFDCYTWWILDVSVGIISSRTINLCEFLSWLWLPLSSLFEEKREETAAQVTFIFVVIYHLQRRKASISSKDKVRKKKMNWKHFHRCRVPRQSKTILVLLHVIRGKRPITNGFVLSSTLLSWLLWVPIRRRR